MQANEGIPKHFEAVIDFLRLRLPFSRFPGSPNHPPLCVSRLFFGGLLPCRFLLPEKYEHQYQIVNFQHGRQRPLRTESVFRYLFADRNPEFPAMPHIWNWDFRFIII